MCVCAELCQRVWATYCPAFSLSLSVVTLSLSFSYLPKFKDSGAIPLSFTGCLDFIRLGQLGALLLAAFAAAVADAQSAGVDDERVQFREFAQ